MPQICLEFWFLGEENQYAGLTAHIRCVYTLKFFWTALVGNQKYNSVLLRIPNFTTSLFGIGKSASRDPPMSNLYLLFPKNSCLKLTGPIKRERFGGGGRWTVQDDCINSITLRSGDCLEQQGIILLQTSRVFLSSCMKMKTPNFLFIL